MKPLAVIVLVMLAAPAATKADAPYPINPGYWEVTTNWMGLVSTTERYCVEPRNISKFLAAPCNHIYHCNYPIQKIADGKAHFDGYIRGNNELYHVVGGGAYSPTSMDVRFSGSGHWKMVPITGAHAALRGRFLTSECPADAKRFK